MKKLALLLLAPSLAACATPAPTRSNAHPAAAAQNSIPFPAGANDCAVIAVVAHGNRDIRGDPPMSSKSYGADCDWNALGIIGLRVAPPDPGPYYEGVRLFFKPPEYSDGGSEATINWSMNGNGGPGRYFFADYKCSAEKRAGKWQFVSCKIGVIT
jgi:hypothetical protein